MHKLLNVIFLIIVFLFLLSIYNYYSSNKNLKTKNFNRKNIDEIISEKIIDLPILSNDTNTVIIFNDSFSNKKDNGKKRSFWDLLRSK